MASTRLVLSGLLALAVGGAQDAGRGNELTPRLVLWAWERPEDLRCIDPAEVSVAFLAATVRLEGDQALARFRAQRLLAPAGTGLIAVVRIETGHHVTLSGRQRRECLHTLLRCARLGGVEGLQVDFDARTSERAFYRELLLEARARMPATHALSITALASWCLEDPWMRRLPIQEAVPMLFRMGPSAASIRARLASGERFRVDACRSALGLSLDERRVPSLQAPRVYVFSPRPWTPRSIREAMYLAVR